MTTTVTTSRILCRDNNGVRLLLKKSILLSRGSPALNKNTASISLLLLLLSLLLLLLLLLFLLLFLLFLLLLFD